MRPTTAHRGRSLGLEPRLERPIIPIPPARYNSRTPGDRDAGHTAPESDAHGTGLSLTHPPKPVIPPAPNGPSALNFHFLAGCHRLLVRYADLAERYAFDVLLALVGGRSFAKPPAFDVVPLPAGG